MSLITPVELKEHVETDLSEDALQRIIDGVEMDCDAIGGKRSELLMEQLVGGDQFIFLSQQAGVIQSIEEQYSGGATWTELTPTDYEIWNGGWNIQRLNSGPNSRRYWARKVRVTYEPVDDSARRTMVIIDVCKLELQYNGLTNETAGASNMTVGDYETKRRQLLSRLRGGLALR